MFKKLLLTLFSVGMSTFGFAACEIPELKKFESKTEPSFLFVSKNHEIVSIDFKRLIRKTIMVESECDPKIKHPVAKGITQIEPSTFNAMKNDVNFRSTFIQIQERYGVDLKANWAKDTYTNIVASYAVYRWKMMDTPYWWDLRYGFHSLGKNFHDNEWNLYKIYYNSIEGKTTLKRWQKFSV